MVSLSWSCDYIPRWEVYLDLVFRVVTAHSTSVSFLDIKETFWLCRFMLLAIIVYLKVNTWWQICIVEIDCTRFRMRSWLYGCVIHICNFKYWVRFWWNQGLPATFFTAKLTVNVSELFRVFQGDFVNRLVFSWKHESRSLGFSFELCILRWFFTSYRIVLFLKL